MKIFQNIHNSEANLRPLQNSHDGTQDGTVCDKIQLLAVVNFYHKGLHSRSTDVPNPPL